VELETLMARREHAAHGYMTQAPVPPLSFKGKLSTLLWPLLLLTLCITEWKEEVPIFPAERSALQGPNHELLARSE
jgi:hypothetical protein